MSNYRILRGRVHTSSGVVIGLLHTRPAPLLSADAERVQKGLLAYAQALPENERYCRELGDKWVTRVCIVIAVCLGCAAWLGHL